jgi:predicted transcriptional regulator
MNLATRKHNLIQELTSIDENLLEKLEIVLRTSKKDWFEDLNDEEKREIEIGLKQADNNDFKSHQTVMKKFDKWY